jgi:hypothetical protein
MKHQSKPLLLIFPIWLLSHYLRCIELARHLSVYFKIKFAANNNYNQFVEMNGFSTFECEAINPHEAIEGLRNFNFSWLSEDNIRRTFLILCRGNRNTASLLFWEMLPALKMAAEFTDVFHISLLNT